MIPILPLMFEFGAADDFEEPRFPGAAWRGAFGYALKRTVCVMRLRPCQGCAFEYSCIYPFIFETRPGRQVTTSIGHGADQTPRPFILSLANGYAGDENPGRRRLGMTLIGPAAHHLPFVIHALAEAGRRGIGRQRQVLSLDRVVDAAAEVIWTPGVNLAPRAAALPRVLARKSSRVVVKLESPLRLVSGGNPITAELLDGPTLSFAAVRRVELLRTCFFDPGSAPDFKALKAQSRSVRIVDRDLDWVDHRRFSTRQSSVITMGGLTGCLTLDLSDAPDLFPYLDTCQWIHVGKGATLGFGQISLEAI